LTLALALPPSPFSPQLLLAADGTPLSLLPRSGKRRQPEGCLCYRSHALRTQ